MSNSETNFSLSAGVIKFREEAKSVSTSVKGPIINSAPNKKQKRALRHWKEKVACAAKDVRGEAKWNPRDLYAVTLEFRFHRHPEQKLDVDNFIKPVLDGVGAGLFLPEDTDPRELLRFDDYHGVDDSNFWILLIHRLPNPPTPEEEGIRLFVSSTHQA